MTGVTTGQRAFKTATGSDDVRDFSVSDLTDNLQEVDDLFHNSTGHNHDASGEGAPIGTGGIASGITLTSPTLASPTMTGTVTAPATNPPPAANAVTAYSTVKGWARITVTAGTPALTASFNVSGIVDNGVGDLTVQWDVDIANDIGPVIVSTGGGTFGGVGAVSGTGAQVLSRDAAGALTDPTVYHVAAFGRQ